MRTVLALSVVVSIGSLISGLRVLGGQANDPAIPSPAVKEMVEILTKGVPPLAQQRASWPSDESMAVLFKAHRLTLERIVVMVREDRKNGAIPLNSVRMDPSWGDPDKPHSQTKKMPKSKFTEYVDLFRVLGLRYGLTVRETEEIDFDVACIGVLAIGPCSYKGIAYRPEIKKPMIVDSLEDEKLPHTGDTVSPGIYLKVLAQDWYIYRWEFD
jgi:hypothetical protein